MSERAPIGSVTWAYLCFLLVLFGMIFLLIRSKVQAARAEIASAESFAAVVKRYDSAAREASNLALRLAECRASQRPEARCIADGGSPTTWSDGFTQCWSADKTKPVLLWSSK